MRKMKDSGIAWIGEIPAEWKVAPLRRIAKIQTGNTPSKVHQDLFYSNKGIPWIKPEDLSSNRSIEQTREYLTDLGCNNARIMPKNSVYVCCIGSVGKVGYSNQQCACNQQINTLSFNSYTYWKYGYYMTISQESEYLLHSNGNVIKIINATEQANLRCPIPPIVEQHRIAAFLDEKCAHIDAVIEKTRASIDEYKKLKQSVITRAVTKGIRQGRKMKNSGIEWIGEIPEEWDVKRLRYMGRCQNGISKGGEFFGSGFPFVSYSDVYKNMEIPQHVNGLVDSTEKERELYSVKRGDIFFTRTSETIEEIGFTAVCKETIDNATFAGFLIRVRPFDENLDVGFSKYYFRGDMHRQFFVKEMNLVTRASLGQELLKKLPVLLPPLPEQQEIASYLDTKTAAIDRLIAKKEQLVAEMESCKKSLIYEVVTGKREVPA